MLSNIGLCRVLFVLALVIVSAGMIKWNVDHPFASMWDESLYINQVIMDAHELREKSVYGFARAILKEDTARPPAYRVFAMPAGALFDGDPRVLRSISLISLLLAVWLVYLAARQLVGSCSSMFAALFFSLSIAVPQASQWFGMEYTLYPALAASLYFIFRHWDSVRPRDMGWIGLGAALGLGAMSKTSFLLVAAPMVGMALFLSWRRWIKGPSPRYFILGGILGLLLALPWWALNYGEALKFAKSSSDFARYTAPWLPSAVQHLFGPVYAVMLFLILSATVLRMLSKSDGGLNKPTLAALWICIAGIFPLLVAHVFSLNHYMRLVSPLLLPCAIALGILVNSFGWHQRRLIVSIAAVIVLVQAVWVSADVVSLKREQWDWSNLRQIAQQYSIDQPVIVHLGNGDAMNPHQISFPWVKAHEPVSERWLWRYEEGEIDWRRIEEMVKSSDLVVTAPGYIGDPEDKQELDNQHNDELVRRLSGSSLFVGPIELTLGQDKTTKLVVFVNKNRVTN